MSALTMTGAAAVGCVAGSLAAMRVWPARSAAQAWSTPVLAWTAALIAGGSWSALAFGGDLALAAYLAGVLGASVITGQTMAELARWASRARGLGGRGKA